MIDLARPPCGWSTGFRATPLTWGLSPKFRQYPDLVFVKSALFFNETEPNDAIEYNEKVFRTPEGSWSKAVWEANSTFISRANVPELRAYWIPAPGNNSIKETLDKRCTYINMNKLGEFKNCFNLGDCVGKYVKLKILKWSVVGK